MGSLNRCFVTAAFALTLLGMATAGAASPGASDRSVASTGSLRLPPECPSGPISPSAEDSDHVALHRRFAPPVISYVQGESKEGDWGFPVLFRVDESGKVACYSVKNFVLPAPAWAIAVPLTDARRQAIARMAAAGYEPFLRDGKPVALFVSEDVREEELPRKHEAPPEVPLESVVIQMSRSGCYDDMCADYSVSVRGDGRVRFEGKNTHVIGVQDYQVPAEDVRELVRSLREKDLWSLRPEYRSPRFSHRPVTLRMDFGGQVHQIVDVSGTDVGMPGVVTQFEREVDRVAATAMWTRLNMAGVEHLRASGFDFSSIEAQKMLGRVFFEGNAEEDAVIRLFELGVPVDTHRSFTPRGGETLRISALEDAASVGMVKLVSYLVSHGGHLSNGKVDQDRLDKAFREAIREGRLASVKALWEAGGPQSRPALTMPIIALGKPDIRHAILALHHDASDERHWDGLEILRWYESLGQDVRVRDGDGSNLLEIAIDAGDEAMARYMVERGIDPNLPGTYGRRPLDVAYTESMTLVLLQAGADIGLVEDGAADFMERAERWQWLDVLAWLKAHGPRSSQP